MISVGLKVSPGHKDGQRLGQKNGDEGPRDQGMVREVNPDIEALEQNSCRKGPKRAPRHRGEVCPRPVHRRDVSAHQEAKRFD